MKPSKLGIFALMTLGGLLAFGPIAGAQDQPTNSGTPPAGGARRGPPTPDKIMEQLKLTDDQKAKVKPILVDQGEKMKSLRDDTSLTPQEKRPKMKEIRDATGAKLKPILTDDQYAQWEKMGQRRGRAGGNNPPGNAPTPPPTAPPATNN